MRQAWIGRGPKTKWAATDQGMAPLAPGTWQPPGTRRTTTHLPTHKCARNGEARADLPWRESPRLLRRRDPDCARTGQGTAVEPEDRAGGAGAAKSEPPTGPPISTSPVAEPLRSTLVVSRGLETRLEHPQEPVDPCNGLAYARRMARRSRAYRYEQSKYRLHARHRGQHRGGLARIRRSALSWSAPRPHRLVAQDPGKPPRGIDTSYLAARDSYICQEERPQGGQGKGQCRQAEQ